MNESKCHHKVENKGMQGMYAFGRNCACKVVFVDAFGRGWCKRHAPDEETKQIWARNAAIDATKEAK